MLVTGLGVFCDGYDISSIALVLPPVLRSYGIAHDVPNMQAAALSAAALVGSMLGALVFGVLAQKGRKRFYGLDVLILGVAALAQAFMPSVWLADRLPLRPRDRRRRRLCALAGDHGRARQPRRPRQGARARLRHHVADRRAGGGAVQAAARLVPRAARPGLEARAGRRRGPGARGDVLPPHRCPRRRAFWPRRRRQGPGARR